MKRWLTTLASVGILAALGPQAAWAQLGTYNPPQTTPGQTISPYLNMIRNNPAANYFGIVQPQFQTYGTLQQMQQQIAYGQGTGINPLGTNTNQLNANNLIMTGHPVTFGYTAQYFPQSGSQLAGMGAGMGVGGFGAGGGGLGGLGGVNFGNNLGGVGVGIVGPTINSPLPQGYAPR